MIEVFKTNINRVRLSRSLIKKLLVHFPGSFMNINMQDCDRVLRVEGNNICPNKIIELVTANGYQCESLI